MSPLIPLIAAAIPEIPKLVADIRALFTRYPALTPDQITAAVVAITTSTDAQADSILAKIAADQVHP
jgi:hypothetical protein